jgi:hypothetical protein
MPNEFYFIRLIHGFTRRPCPGERVWDVGQLLRASVLRFLRARNLQGFDVYLLPFAEYGNAGYVLLDLDHPADILPRMRANGHEPCVLLQTSPGHLQAWIRVSTTPLEAAVATVISRHLAHAYGGDLASTGSSHLGRLAGFTNQKPQRRTIGGHAPWVRIVEARGVVASAAPDLLRSATQVVTQLPTDTPNHLSLADNPASTITVQGATRIYQRWMQHWHIRERFAQPDWSIVDLWLARKLLAMHISPTQVETILRLGSPLFPRQHGDVENYLRRTLARAALPPPRTVCSSHAPAPLTPGDETDKDFSNSRGGR